MAFRSMRSTSYLWESCKNHLSNANLVVAPLIDQQVVLKSWLCVTVLHTCRETAIGRFDVAIAVVNTDDVNSVFVFHLFVPFKI